MVRNPLARVPGAGHDVPNADRFRFHSRSSRAQRVHWHLAYGNGSDTMRLLFALSSHEMLGGRMAVRREGANRDRVGRRETRQSCGVE